MSDGVSEYQIETVRIDPRYACSRKNEGGLVGENRTIRKLFSFDVHLWRRLGGHSIYRVHHACRPLILSLLLVQERDAQPAWTPEGVVGRVAVE
jgi:hypothetical protein